MRRSPFELVVGPSGPVGNWKVNVCTVDAGWRVDAMISTSRVKESLSDLLSILPRSDLDSVPSLFEL